MEKEIKILDRFSTASGLLFTVRDNNHYQVGQTVRYNGVNYTITGINPNDSLNLVGLKVVRKP